MDRGVRQLAGRARQTVDDWLAVLATGDLDRVTAAVEHYVRLIENPSGRSARADIQ
ncbi:hypothetical protein ACFWY5_54625 [Nonomuraea sp. NPDC059007]|uniref:hypothetical protein n=1 Tax=Nonomuraea sp. NPDC059007 TaxID=3346692 RepID=UPI0036C0433C